MQVDTKGISDITRIVTQVSVGLAVMTFLGAVVADWIQKLDSGLESHLAKSGAAAAIPTSVVLVYGAFRPDIIPQLTELHVPIAVAGLSLLYVSIRAMFK